MKEPRLKCPKNDYEDEDDDVPDDGDVPDDDDGTLPDTTTKEEKGMRVGGSQELRSTPKEVQVTKLVPPDQLTDQRGGAGSGPRRGRSTHPPRRGRPSTPRGTGAGDIRRWLSRGPKGGLTVGGTLNSDRRESESQRGRRQADNGPVEED